MADKKREMTTVGKFSQGTLVVIALTFLTVAGVLAFNSSVGVPALQDMLNSSETSVTSLVDKIVSDADAIKRACGYDSNQECADHIQEVIDELNLLKYKEGEMRGVYHAGHVWAQYHKLNINSTMEGMEDGENLLADINNLSDAHTVYNVLSHVRTALTIIFTLILIYMAALVIEKALESYNKLTGQFGWKAFLYWTTHVHVFIITLLATYVFIVAFQNDFFMDQVDFACRTRETALVKDVYSHNKTVLMDSFSFNTTCIHESKEIVNGTFSYLFWVLVMFSQLYISTHFTVRHGAASDLVATVEHDISSLSGARAGTAPTNAKKIVYGYQPLTSVHNRR